jgi:hypothetical protein
MAMKKVNVGEELLAKHLKELGLQFVRGFAFDPGRRWEADFRITNRLLNGQEILIEVEGGIWTRGRHTRGKGYEEDMRKYNRASVGGFMVLRFSTGQVKSLEAQDFLRKWLVR